MPRAMQLMANQLPIGKRSSIVRARRCNGKYFIALAREQNRFTIHLTHQKSSVGNISEGNSRTQLRA